MKTENAKEYLKKKYSHLSESDFFFDRILSIFLKDIVQLMEEYRNQPHLPDEDEKTRAAMYLEDCHISGDTMVKMDHSLDDIPEDQRGSIYLHDLLAAYAGPICHLPAIYHLPAINALSQKMYGCDYSAVHLPERRAELLEKYLGIERKSENKVSPRE